MLLYPHNDYNSVAGLEFGYRSQNGKWQGSGGLGIAFTEDENDQNYFYSASTGFDGKAFNFMSMPRAWETVIKMISVLSHVKIITMP